MVINRITEVEKEKYKLSKIWNKLVDKDVHGNIADIIPRFYNIAYEQGKSSAIKNFDKVMDEQFDMGRKSKIKEFLEIIDKYSYEIGIKYPVEVIDVKELKAKLQEKK